MNKVKDIERIIACLEESPLILESFIQEIPIELLKTHRIPNKWSIHEHVCHLPQAERMITKRFEIFKKEEKPQFKPYLPGTTVADDMLLTLDLKEEIDNFKKLRTVLIKLVKSFDPSIWQRQAEHPEYKKYTPYILLRHTLMHDHFHMYRMEQLWLTSEEYLLIP